MPAPGSERLHALDAVRGFALLAGIVFHATMSFLAAPPGVPLWIVMDSQRSLRSAVLFHVLHIFRMTTFFLIAGFFAHMMFHRRGDGGFVARPAEAHRHPAAGRLADPVCGDHRGDDLGRGRMAHGQPLPPPPKYPGLPRLPADPSVVPLRAAVALCGNPHPEGRRDVRWTATARSAGRPTGWWRRGWSTRRSAILLLAAPTALALYLTPRWLMWFGVPTPDSSLVPNVAAAVAYFTAFGFGWLLHRQRRSAGGAGSATGRSTWRSALAFSIAGLAHHRTDAAARAAPPGLAKARLRGVLRTGGMELDVRHHRHGAAVPRQLQPHAPLHRRRVLLALSRAHAADHGAAGRGLAARLAVAG